MCSVLNFSPLGRSENNIHVDGTSDRPLRPPPITDLGYCHPTTGKNYTVFMVESYRSTLPYGPPALNSTLHDVTPVMTVFYPNSSSQQAMLVDVHLTCLTVVGVNFSATLATDSVGTGVRAVSVWSFVGLGLMSGDILRALEGILEERMVCVKR
ncbi:hypothetical protein CNMCM6106_007857 [Aspergillus hiratsukae]|uniref:Uncharacterized protein n=1 Tax=Aspergillus hiratsukae TaxID=1194566 RepID=A0A8H6ULN5_9EURO|nr:hypothetical protein CNMCM6106_007857 [Aspergillus hiratsukae]